MILRDVRCVLTNWYLVAIGFTAYIATINSGAFGGSINWLYILLVSHLFIGLFRIALKNRPLAFGLSNLVAEMFFLVTVAFLSVLPMKSFSANLNGCVSKWAKLIGRSMTVFRG
jgi:hypothetical protein